jgi:hypothetical protein
MLNVHQLLPKWAASAAALQRSNALVRSQCRVCGLQQRVDAGYLAYRHGATASLIGATERCSVVGCNGSVFYMAARTYGRAWLKLVDLDGEGKAGALAPPINALSLKRG